MDKIKKIKIDLANWLDEELLIIPWGKDNWEIKTIEPDAYGDDVLLFLQQKNNQYLLGDDGRMLFKLDPGAQDQELYHTAQEIVLGSGYAFDAAHGVIFCQIDPDQLAGVIMRLAQLEVAISYLG